MQLAQLTCWLSAKFLHHRDWAEAGRSTHAHRQGPRVCGLVGVHVSGGSTAYPRIALYAPAPRLICSAPGIPAWPLRSVDLLGIKRTTVYGCLG